MASSAALLAGLQSFDSSQEGASHQITHNYPGEITAASFRFDQEEEEDERRMAQGYRARNEDQMHDDRSINDVTDGGHQQSEPAARQDGRINKQQQHHQSDPPLSSTQQHLPPLPAASSYAVPTSRNARAEDQFSLQSRLQSNHLPSAVLDLSSRFEGQSESRDESWRQADEASSVMLAYEEPVARGTVVGRGAAGSGAKGDGGPARPNLALRDQEKAIDEMKKENFALKFKIHFLTEQLVSLSPDSIASALKDHVELQVESATMRQELKRYKKLLLVAERTIQSTVKERDEMGTSQLRMMGGNAREEDLLAKLDAERKNRDELEKRVRLQEQELIDFERRGAGNDPSSPEDSRAEISRLRSELDSEREAREELLADHDYLQNQYTDANDQLEEAVAENARLRGGDEGTSANGVDDSNVEERRVREQETKREMAKLLRSNGTLEKDKEMLAVEVESLEDQLEVVKQEINRLENENEQLELANARAGADRSDEEEMTRSHLHEENNHYRDRASAHALALSEKESEIQELLQNIASSKIDHEEKILEMEEDWKAEVNAIQDEADKLQDTLEVRDGEIAELVGQLDQSDTAQKQDEADIDELRLAVEERDSDIVGLTDEASALESDLKKLSDRIEDLEEELEESHRELTKMRTDLTGVDQESDDKQILYEQIVGALKEQNVTTKKNLEDELSELLSSLRKSEEDRGQDQIDWKRQEREYEARLQTTLDAKDKHVQELAQAKERLRIRESDVAKLQDALNGLQTESRRLGETHTSDRFSMELELDRTKRDLARCETELISATGENERRSALLSQRELALATLKSETKDVTAQLAAQTQTRLDLTDKFDQTAKKLRDSQNELSAAKDRLNVVEDQLTHDHRALSRTESQYRDQLTERNTLLLTVYQKIDKAVSSNDATPRKAGFSDPKPFNNFLVFNETLSRRMKSLDVMMVSFEKRLREKDALLSEKDALHGRDLDVKRRQLERFESEAKAALEGQKQWREKVISRQTELDAAKSANQELQAQLVSLRRSTSSAAAASTDSSTSSTLSSLSVRASTAERHLVATQLQLKSAEEKLEDARGKVALAEGKWESRLRELELRLRGSEEKVKRERQGAKERVAELGTTIRSLEGQVQGAGRRNQQLETVIKSVSHS